MPREPKDGYSLAMMRMISRELKKIRVTKGAITADNVLEAARAESHPLHRFFEWDDAAAAEKYRRQQALHMIARVTVTVDVNGEQRPVRAFIGVNKDDMRQYVPAVEVLNDEQLQGQVLTEMKNDLEAMRRRFETYGFCAEAVDLLKRAIVVLDEPVRRRQA